MSKNVFGKDLNTFYFSNESSQKTSPMLRQINTLPNGFADPLLFGSFKLAGKDSYICLNDALTALSTSTSFPLARKAK